MSDKDWLWVLIFYYDQNFEYEIIRDNDIDLSDIWYICIDLLPHQFFLIT